MTSAAHQDRASGVQRANILIVDDLQEKHVAFHGILEELGENIISARSGKEALAQVLNNEFAVILLDVNMPDIDGLETASLIRRHKRSAQTPIVFITAYVDELQAKRGYALGAVDYISSPVVPEVLRSKVKVFVELYRMNRQLQLRAAEREALARAEAARAAAQEATARADFLAEASQLLSRSLDLEHTSRTLLQICVPMLAERALLVTLLGDGIVTRVQGYPEPVGDLQVEPSGLREAIHQALDHRQVEQWQHGDRAAVIHPLLTGDRSRGALALLGPPDHFDRPRMALANEVVSRACIAMENARLYAAVQEADRRKNEFLAMLAHELRNPLAPIRNAVHIMQSPEAPTQTLNWARDVISRQADHMARLIDDLLDVSRIVQGKVVVKPEVLDLSALVERSVESSSPRLAARNQQLKVQLPAESLQLDGDAVRLAQVLSNLINNASKFSAPNTAIELKAGFDGSELIISVRDWGCGIDPEFLPHIFDLFVQGDQSLDRSQGGLGVGLTLVKHLVELHGGQVEALSEGRGHGTEVVVRLPARLALPVAREPRPLYRLEQPPQQRLGSRVLVVDDLAASAETLTTLLEMEGFQVKTASDGTTALKVAEEFRPDVVLLDIGLPGMNGFEVATRLRNQPSSQDALIIALTGYGEAESRSRSTEAGFDFHMVKPADVSLLLSMIADPQRVRRNREI